MIIWEKDLSLLKTLLIISEYFHPRVHLLVARLWLLLSNQITTNPQTLLIWGVSTGVGSSQKNKRLEPYIRHFCGKTTYPCFERLLYIPVRKGMETSPKWKKRTKSSSKPIVILDTSSHFSLSLWERFMNMFRFSSLLRSTCSFCNACRKDQGIFDQIKGAKKPQQGWVDVAQSLENNYQSFRNKAIINSKTLRITVKEVPHFPLMNEIAMIIKSIWSYKQTLLVCSHRQNSES